MGWEMGVMFVSGGVIRDAIADLEAGAPWHWPTFWIVLATFNAIVSLRHVGVF